MTYAYVFAKYSKLIIFFTKTEKKTKMKTF